MVDQKKMSNQLKQLAAKVFPIVFIGLFFFVFPPIALAILFAFFTSPLLNAIRSTTKLPLTIATCLVLIFILLMITSFFYVAIYGLIDFIPLIENKFSLLTMDIDYIGKVIYLFEIKIVEYSEALLEYAFSLIQRVFQQMFNLFVFILCYFFALRESGKSRFWFVVYFPVRFRAYVQRLFAKASEIVNTFFYVEARLIFLTFLILCVGFFLLKFQSPVSLAFLISIADSLPFIGIGLFLIPMGIYYFYIGEIWIGSFITIIYLIAIIARQIGESYLWATTFQIRPIHAFLLLACMVYAFGIVGILLSPFLLFAAYKLKTHPLFNE